MPPPNAFTNNGTRSVGDYKNLSNPNAAAVPLYLVTTLTPTSVAGYTGTTTGNFVPITSINQMTITYERPRILRQVTDMIVETPAGCAKDAYCKADADAWTSTGSVNDQASTDRWNCTDASNSRVFSGVNVTPDTAVGLTELYPGVPASPPAPICYEADARNYSCNFNLGQMACYTDINGDQQCPENTGGVQSTCGAMEANPACSFLSSTCTLQDADSGVCHNYTDAYDCGFNVDIPGSSTSTSTLVCPGQLRCVGTECITPQTDTANTDFVKAATLLSTTQFLQMDTKCTTVGNCEVFAGKANTCKKAVAGIVNCCNKPAGVSLVDYMKLTYATWDVTKATDAAKAIEAAGANTAGELVMLGNNMVSNFTDVQQPLTTAWDSLFGGASGATTAAATQPLYQAAGNFLNTISPNLGGSVFNLNSSIEDVFQSQ